MISIIILCVLHSLLVAIGIEAFIKFSQEQKQEESEGDTSVRSSSLSGANGDETSIPKRLASFMKKMLSGLAAFASAAFSSARVSVCVSVGVGVGVHCRCVGVPGVYDSL